MIYALKNADIMKHKNMEKITIETKVRNEAGSLESAEENFGKMQSWFSRQDAEADLMSDMMREEEADILESTTSLEEKVGE